MNNGPNRTLLRMLLQINGSFEDANDAGPNAAQRFVNLCLQPTTLAQGPFSPLFELLFIDRRRHRCRLSTKEPKE